MTSQPVAIICGVDEPQPYPVPDPDCPNAAGHEPQPRGFIPSGEWALRKMLTHHQPHPCPGCGKWWIWAEGPVTDGDLSRADILEMLGEDPEP